jgi:hypothetical protein
MTRPLFVHFPLHDRATVHPANQGSAGEQSPNLVRSVRRARRLGGGKCAVLGVPATETTSFCTCPEARRLVNAYSGAHVVSHWTQWTSSSGSPASSTSIQSTSLTPPTSIS